MKKKVCYLTYWTARDISKYPNGLGFEAPVVDFESDIDPALASSICAESLSNDEFICLGATPRLLYDGDFELRGIVPESHPHPYEDCIRSIDMILGFNDLPKERRLEMINAEVRKAWGQDVE